MEVWPSTIKTKAWSIFYFDKRQAQTYHTAPMSGGLPEFFDLTKAGHTPLTVAGNLSLSRMPRLCAELADNDGQARIALRVYKEGELAVASGRVRANLSLTCQRCFGLLRHPVDANIRLAWAGKLRQADHWSSSYEMLESESGRIKLAELIEDELLLALPLVVRHAKAEDCGAQPEVSANTETGPSPEAGGVHLRF